MQARVYPEDTLLESKSLIKYEGFDAENVQDIAAKASGRMTASLISPQPNSPKRMPIYLQKKKIYIYVYISHFPEF